MPGPAADPAMPGADLRRLERFGDFSSTARAVLGFLHERLKLSLWMVTRKDGEDWVVLAAAEHGSNVIEGRVVRWWDSFCSQMVERLGPEIVPSAEGALADAVTPFGDRMPVAAYVGVPLVGPDGELLGTLCGFDPSPQPEEIREELPMIELVARMLATVLGAERRAADESRRAERAEADSLIDPLTGLGNRRYWTDLLASEEDRCRRHARPASVVAIDLDHLKVVNDTEGHAAGDVVLRRAGSALLQASRGHDVVARVGGDEFAVLAVECPPASAEALARRLGDALHGEGIPASIGVASRSNDTDLYRAWERADAAMYEAKRGRVAGSA